MCNDHKTVENKFSWVSNRTNCFSGAKMKLFTYYVVFMALKESELVHWEVGEVMWKLLSGWTTVYKTIVSAKTKQIVITILKMTTLLKNLLSNYNSNYFWAINFHLNSISFPNYCWKLLIHTHLKLKWELKVEKNCFMWHF